MSHRPLKASFILQKFVVKSQNIFGLEEDSYMGIENPIFQEQAAKDLFENFNFHFLCKKT